jgi:hypothetical protein
MAVGERLRRRRGLLGLLVLAYTPALLALSLLALPRDEVRFALLLRDPASQAGLPFYAGALSSLGILLWYATAVVCFYSALLGGRKGLPARRRAFLAYGGVLTALLLLDDLFMVHEEALPLLLSRAEAWSYALYLALVLGLFLLFHREVLASNFALLALAFLFFGLSLGLDQAPLGGLPGLWRLKSIAVEDALKLLGVGSWFLYYSRAAWRSLA